MIENTRASATNSGPVGGHTTTAGVDRLAAGAHSGIHTAAEAAHRVVDSADEAANHATDAMARAGNKAGVKGEELYAAGAGYMRDHPVVTLGAAVAAGYLLSRLLATR
ncbi:hypothetical protein [Thioalkalivibrio sp. XN279]|uniref:hypothetical protein n=1 Tax=Thioalkalivibrio sp. XN279 TaxID=2714953 RepID=UPI00140D93F6|nr:hypothetical protein [Thioalkalivibrio sp. XN279]NHA14641.1 hypothetical protein [Thioalkalivibrio sp. XN279]